MKRPCASCDWAGLRSVIAHSQFIEPVILDVLPQRAVRPVETDWTGSVFRTPCPSVSRLVYKADHNAN
jgi:hypothetical protein